ncbi:MAG: hypothetical protein MPW15_07400 [Candidatus Manganitrophus sp.]|nr:hypothetical protein [Candidatus Manganitrophus sp.]
MHLSPIPLSKHRLTVRYSHHRSTLARLFKIGTLLSLLLLTACGPSLRHQQLVEQHLGSHRYADADAVVEKNKNDYGDRNLLLYYLDRAFLLHLAGRYEESNRFFEKATAEVDRLYTQSISTHAGAMLTNDNLLPYEGEDFETVLIHLFSALNYAALGRWDDALVEARQVDARLNLLNDRYAEKNVYKEDAFARYLAGVLYELRGESNDAFISYRKAYETFQSYKKNYQTPIPSRLGVDLIRITHTLHLSEEQEEYKRLFPQAVAIPSGKTFNQGGEVVVVTYEGRSPVKEDYFIDAPVPDGGGGVYLVRVALPRFVPRPSRIGSVEVTFRQGETLLKQKADVMEDITAIAKKNLEDRIARISSKAIARATTKYIAARTAKHQAKKKGGEGAEILTDFLTNVYSLATEQSDKRSWQTLPAKIRLARISLPPGEWEVRIAYYSDQGRLVEERPLSPLKIEKGKQQFLIDHLLQ